MSASIKKLIVKLLAFIPFALAIYIILVCLWGDFASKEARKNLIYQKSTTSFFHSRMEEVKKVKNIDILVLGSSHAYRGFDPRIFKAAGFTMFNMGTPAQTATQTQVLVERYLDRLNPKIILYEVYPKTFSIDGVESALNLIANDKNDFETFKMCLKMKHILPINTFIYASFRDVIGRDRMFKDRNYEGNAYVKGGFVERTKIEYNTATHEKTKWDLNESQFESFGKILAEIRRRGIKVYLINAPIPSNYYKSVSNNEEFDRRMRASGEYFNFNGRVDLNDSIDFYDTSHLNQTGVVKFNNKLINTIFKK
jgi:hypothetical protein